MIDMVIDNYAEPHSFVKPSRHLIDWLVVLHHFDVQSIHMVLTADRTRRAAVTCSFVQKGGSIFPGPRRAFDNCDSGCNIEHTLESIFHQLRHGGQEPCV